MGRAVNHAANQIFSIANNMDYDLLNAFREDRDLFAESVGADVAGFVDEILIGGFSDKDITRQDVLDPFLNDPIDETNRVNTGAFFGTFQRFQNTEEQFQNLGVNLEGNLLQASGEVNVVNKGQFQRFSRDFDQASIFDFSIDSTLGESVTKNVSGTGLQVVEQIEKLRKDFEVIGEQRISDLISQADAREEQLRRAASTTDVRLPGVRRN